MSVPASPMAAPAPFVRQSPRHRMSGDDEMTDVRQSPRRRTSREDETGADGRKSLDATELHTPASPQQTPTAARRLAYVCLVR